jgi:5-methylcytosine-specific restriction endonuclease McrA
VEEPQRTSPSGSGIPRSASPSAERLASALGELVAATLSDDEAQAEQVLAEIGQHRIEIEQRRAIPTTHRVAIHRRDSWTCRYCRARTIAPPVLRFLSEIYPDEVPFHKNWKAGQVHPAYLLISTSLDHVNPGGRGGSWLDEDNLVTACWPCNTGKADLRLDEVGWTLLSETEVRSDWDGLTGATNALWGRAGHPDIYRDWRRALSIP